MAAGIAFRIGVIIVCGGITAACSRPMLTAGPRVPDGKPGAPLAELWIEPADIAQRDLFWGPGSREDAPAAGTEYEVEERDRTGYSRGFDATGPDGREWDIKVGNEVQSEIAVSRILWAIGYHQPATYYVTDWTLEGTWETEGEPARFRLQSDHETDGEWAWLDNPFSDTVALRGLIAINLLLNNWDFKTSNNRIYRVKSRGAGPARRYVVQDVGASLGKTRGFPFLLGTRNDIDDFEETRLIRRVSGTQVELDFSGRHRGVLDELRVTDVTWACRLLNRLSDRQLDDAFRAAGFADDVRGRYVAKVREKIREGLELPGGLRARAEADE